MIHVLIERHIAHTMVSTYEDYSKKALRKTYGQEGFISAESFTDTEDENHRFVMSKWRSKHDWTRWFKSTERRDLLNTISPMLSQPEKVTAIVN